MAEKEVQLTIAELSKLTDEVRAPGGPPAAAPQTKRFNEALIAAMRAGKGKIEGELAGLPLLILSNTGRKSGERRENPLAYFLIEKRLFIVASMGGADQNPPWYFNIVATPDVGVEVNGVTFPAKAKTVGDAEHERIYAAVCRVLPVFADYQKRTTRRIPVIELIATPADLDRAFGDALR